MIRPRWLVPVVLVLAQQTVPRPPATAHRQAAARFVDVTAKSKIDVGGSLVNVKSKWDKNALKQEFSNSQAKLVETWSVDEAGRLVLTAKLESMTLTTPDEKAVFDRQ